MAIWPFRSRPVVAPFRDDYAASVIHYPGNFDLANTDLYIPDNVYFLPSTIILHLRTDVSHLITTTSHLAIYRGGIPVYIEPFVNLPNSFNGYFVFSHAGQPPSAFVSNFILTFPLALGLYLYPSDRINIQMPSRTLDDRFYNAYIFGRQWEVH